MIRGRNMTTAGFRFAWLLGLLIVFFLPKEVDCGYPGHACTTRQHGETCTYSEVEPFGFYGLESLFHRDIGFAYSTDTDCR